MKKTVLKVVAIMLVAVVLGSLLVSCGKTLSGTYETAIGTPTFTFKGNKVTLEIDLILTAKTIEGTYEIEDDKITFAWEGENADDAKDYSGTLAFAEGDGYITIGGVKYNKAEK